MECPHCRSSEVQARGKRYALYPLGIVAIVGWPLAMLHQASSPREYHCEGCGADFSQRTTFAKIARFVLIAFCLAFALVIATAIIGTMLTRQR